MRIWVYEQQQRFDVWGWTCVDVFASGFDAPAKPKKKRPAKKKAKARKR